MIYKIPSPLTGHVRIVFELPSCLWADRIFLVGDFNQWQENVTPMQQDRDGVWRATVDFPKGSSCQFRYLIDGQWKTDYHADGFAQSGYGAENSVVHATLPIPVIEGLDPKVSDLLPSGQPAAMRNKAGSLSAYRLQKQKQATAPKLKLVAA